MGLCHPGTYSLTYYRHPSVCLFVVYLRISPGSNATHIRHIGTEHCPERVFGPLSSGSEWLNCRVLLLHSEKDADGKVLSHEAYLHFLEVGAISLHVAPVVHGVVFPSLRTS